MKASKASISSITAKLGEAAAINFANATPINGETDFGDSTLEVVFSCSEEAKI